MAFDATRFRELRLARGLGLGEPLELHGVTGSTNDDALEASRRGAPHGATFVAESQTAGRGRRSSRWLSRPSESLLFSLLLRPELPADRLSGLALVTGIAVRDAVAPLIGAVARLKWPNDVLVLDKKLAGVLIESQIRGSEPSAVVVGVGLNVGALEFPAELAASATSLALLGASEVSREALLVELLSALEVRLESYRKSGLASLHGELEAADALAGRPIRVDGVPGVARGIDEHGRLLVEDASGRLEAVLAGSVELV